MYKDGIISKIGFLDKYFYEVYKKKEDNMSFIALDIANNDNVSAMFVFEPQARYLLASNTGRGFIVDENHILAQTRAGRKIMNVAQGEKTVLCLKVSGNMTAIVGENRKLIIFKTEEIPTMARGHGVALQKYKDGGMSDVQFFDEENGFSFSRSGGVGNEKNLMTWLGHRGQAGKLVPFGFPKNNKFFN